MGAGKHKSSIDTPGSLWKKEINLFSSCLGLDPRSSHPHRATAFSLTTIPNKKVPLPPNTPTPEYSDCRRNTSFLDETYHNPFLRLCFHLHAVTTDKALSFTRSKRLRDTGFRTNEEDFAAYRFILLDIDTPTSFLSLRRKLKKYGLSSWVRLIVESSPNKFHVYIALNTWRFAKDKPEAKNFPITHKYLAQLFHADPSVGVRGVQVVQVPGQPRPDAPLNLSSASLSSASPYGSVFHSRVRYTNQKSPQITPEQLFTHHTRLQILHPTAIQSSPPTDPTALTPTQKALQTATKLLKEKPTPTPNSHKWTSTRNTPHSITQALDQIRSIIHEDLPAKYVPRIKLLLKALEIPLIAFGSLEKNGSSPWNSVTLHFPASILKNVKNYASAIRHLQNLGILTKTSYKIPTNGKKGRTRTYTLQWKESKLPKSITRFDYEQRFPRHLTAKASALALQTIQQLQPPKPPTIPEQKTPSNPSPNLQDPFHSPSRNPPSNNVYPTHSNSSNFSNNFKFLGSTFPSSSPLPLQLVRPEGEVFFRNTIMTQGIQHTAPPN